MAIPKNTVIIMTDQHSPKMLGCAGHPQVLTPNLDLLAANGVYFSSAYTPSPLCVPARAALATGRYVHQINCWDNAIAWKGEPAGWPQSLPSVGHYTVSIGKLHYRSEEDPIGFNERIIPMPIHDYGISKYYAEKEIQAWVSKELNVRAIILRPAAVYGPKINANIFDLIY